MPLDTAAKRNAALLETVGIPLPDGALDAADRQTMLGDYGPFDAPPAPGPGAHQLASLGCGG
jgi:hypothetical protein